MNGPKRRLDHWRRPLRAVRRLSVDARLVEQDVRPHHQARAEAIQPGTLEILDSVGLLPAFLGASEHVRRVRVYGPDFCELSGLDFEGIDCRCEFQCSLPQYETQRILEAHLSSLGGVLERGVTATKVDADAGDVQVELAHPDGGVETLNPGVVIDAGGAHSVTRRSMSDPLEGTTYQGHFLVADIAMEAPVARDQGSFFCGPEGMMLLAPLPGGRWLTFQDLEEGVRSVSAEDVVSRTEARIGGRGRPTDVAWFSPFRMHRRIVSRLADGRRGPDPPRRPHRLPVPARRRGRARGPREPPLLVPDSGPDRIGAVKEAKGVVVDTGR
jgi:2-polyprenyl-6-methoxyphenol hydroxylase-like FAD-dependent oxidoreductase